MHLGLEKVEGRPHLLRRRVAPVEPVGKQPNGRTTFEGAKARRAAG
jgi:hypothetical protein